MFKNFFFDYIYYRLYKLNVNKDEYQGMPALLVVSLIQALLINGLIGIMIRFFYDRITVAPYAKGFVYLSIVICVIMIVLNYRKFWKNVSVFEERWENEPKFIKRIKGWIIVLTLILSFSPNFIIDYFFD